MYLTCKCLNVSVKTRGTELKPFKVDDASLSELERDDEFFQQPLATAIQLEGINKEQSALLISKTVGPWAIYRCINCSMYTHAVNRNHGAALVLINTNIVSSSVEIDKLKSDSRYSPIFRIIVDQSLLDDNNPQQTLTKYSVSDLSNSFQLSLANLQQQLEQAVQKKAAEIEEVVRNFTAEQYQILEQFRERAHLEHHVLAKIVCAEDSSNNIETKISTSKRIPVTPCDDIISGIKASDSGFITGIELGPRATLKSAEIDNNFGTEKKIKRVKSLDKNKNLDEDVDLMFDLEGMDHSSSTKDNIEASQDEEDDTDDSGQDEGIYIPKGERGGHPTIAKSLPVSVPNFSRYVPIASRDRNGDQESMDPLDPHNIRASIKALAKSVHGDAVFGDLPRPRFSTQI